MAASLLGRDHRYSVGENGARPGSFHCKGGCVPRPPPFILRRLRIPHPALLSAVRIRRLTCTNYAGKAGITALVSVKGGAAPGTYACKEMVYACAICTQAVLRK